MDIGKDLIHISRLLIEKNYEDAISIARRSMKKIIKERIDLEQDATLILNKIDNASLIRAGQFENSPLPVDMDSRLELLKRDLKPSFDSNIIWPKQVQANLNETLTEREKLDVLLEEGLNPTKSLLFVGPPGVGKTIAAKWLAAKLNRPLLTLDLSAVMSSYLGRTGGNIRVVLDYARSFPCVLLLDEFDSIAKRRDDSGEIGELKRLVTVLLQEIDSWPSSGLLVAATNHPELLDPAVWRRFDRVIEFPNPTISEIKNLISNLVGETLVESNSGLIETVSSICLGKSFSEVTRIINLKRKEALINSIDLVDLFKKFIFEHVATLEKEKKILLVSSMINSGQSERQACEILNLPRSTYRNRKVKINIDN